MAKAMELSRQGGAWILSELNDQTFLFHNECIRWLETAFQRRGTYRVGDVHRVGGRFGKLVEMLGLGDAAQPCDIEV